MANGDTQVTIVAWPKEPAQLEHQFKEDSPLPVTISFDETAARVIVSTDPQKPLAVDMNMRVSAREPIPLCIKLCEPICAKSDYTIGINIFDNPFATINVRGTTRLGDCREEPPPKQSVCVAFDQIMQGQVFTSAFSEQGLTFTPLGGELRAVTFGEPAGRMKLAFTDAGVRIDFPQPVEDVVLTLNDYASPNLQISVFAGTTLLNQFTVSIANTVKDVTLSQSGITAITVVGGKNEAALVQVCYRPAAPGTVVIGSKG